MRLTCQRDDLKDAVSMASKPVGNKATQANLRYILLEASDDHLSVSGADLRMHASVAIEADVSEPGSVMVLPDRFEDVLNQCPPSRSVSLTVSGSHRVTVACGGVTVRMNGIDPDLFMSVPILHDAVSFTVPSVTLCELIDSTAFVARQDDARPALAAVSVAVRAGMLTLATMDGERAAQATAKIGDGCADLSILIPGSSLKMVASSLAKRDAPVTVAYGQTGSSSRCRIVCGDEAWYLTLIDGTFPDVNRLAPSKVGMRIVCDRADFLRAMNLARLSDTGTLKAIITPTEGGITMTSTDGQGDTSCDMQISARVTGNIGRFALNAKNGKEAADAIDAEQIAIILESPLRPFVIRAGGPATGHRHILAPMVIKD